MIENRRCIASHADESDYLPFSRWLLWKLGYALLPAAEAELPALRVVREERLDELDPDPWVPVVVLTGRRWVEAARGSAVIGGIQRPAGVPELYRLFQAALEAHPRSVPRVATRLPARASSGAEHWELVVRSLSANGCLADGLSVPPVQSDLELEIELPWGERLAGPARVAYDRAGQRGLVFQELPLPVHQRLSEAVVELLERL